MKSKIWCYDVDTHTDFELIIIDHVFLNTVVVK
jgi:hypothetical protein